MRLFSAVKSEKGGIGAIIAMIVGIILVLGLVAYAVLGQVAGAKDTGDKAQIEQDKINRMLENPNIVTGNIIKNYVQSNVAVTVNTVAITTTNISTIVDGSLYEITGKHTNDDGRLSSIVCTKVSLSR
ncbi:MAG TPA: hypothetical protein VHP38_07290 [Ruminiclostridium sp.]|nr:hypothetical protein [Ruminiclostridium sp.]